MPEKDTVSYRFNSELNRTIHSLKSHNNMIQIPMGMVGLGDVGFKKAGKLEPEGIWAI